MPNKTIYDNSNSVLYIRLSENNPDTNIHIIDQIENNPASIIIIDARGLSTNDFDSFKMILERIKSKNDIISIVDDKTLGSIRDYLASISSSTINYDRIIFGSKEEEIAFADNIIEQVLKLSTNKTEKLNMSSEEIYYNAAARNYLNLILQDFGKYLSKETIVYLKTLIEKDNVILEQNHEDYVRFKESLGEKIAPENSPSFHDGKVFGDNKIHIYLNKFPDHKREDIESVLIYELFHYIVKPVYSEKYPFFPNLNSDITKGLVDMLALDFLIKHGVFPNYQSNYTNNVIFVREKLKTVGGPEERYMLALNGTIDQFIAATSKNAEEFIEEYKSFCAKETKIDKLISNISSLDQVHAEGYKRSLLKLISRIGIDAALPVIKDTFLEMTPEMMPGKTKEDIESIKKQVSTYINEYTNQQHVKLVA